MTRCPACAYHFGPRDGAPNAIGEAFSEDVRCPECGLPIPAGSRVVVGSSSAYAVGAKLSWSTAWPFVVLAGVAVFLWIPEAVGALFRWFSGGGPPTVMNVLALVVLVSWAIPVVSYLYIRRARKQRGRASEDAIAPHERLLVARGWMFAPGWLVVFDRSTRLPSFEAIDARLVRSVRARLCAESGEGVHAACEIAARLLPHGPPAAPPVHAHIDGAPVALAAAFDATLRIPAAVDLVERLVEWQKTDGAGGVRVHVRQPDRVQSAAVQSHARPAIEVLDDGRLVIVRGSPADVAPVPPVATMRSIWVLLAVPILSLLVGALVLGWMTRSQSPAFMILPLLAFALPLAAVIVVPWIQKRGAYAEEAEWRISASGVEILCANSRVHLDAISIRSIDLAEPFGVPQLVLRITRSSDSHATLVPHNWARLAPETVLAQVRAAASSGAPAGSMT